jgi:t-SNARE complex subunit (syntaxin)
MGILGPLFSRVTTTRDDWLRQVREEAPTLKAQQEAASEAHLEEMWAVERHRRETLARARAERDRQQRLIIALASIIVIAVVITIIITVVVSLTHTPSPYPYPLR